MPRKTILASVLGLALVANPPSPLGAVERIGAEPKTPQPRPETGQLLNQGEQLLARSQPDSALSVAKRAVDASDQVDLPGRASAMRLEARCYRSLDRPDDALAAWQAVEAAWRQAGSGPGAIEALCEQAWLLVDRDSSRASLLISEAIAASAGETIRPVGASTALSEAARQASRLARLETAERLASGALQVAEKSPGGAAASATSLDLLGDIAITRGRFEETWGLYHGALVARQRAGDDSLGIATSLCNLGELARRQDRPDTALAYQRLALAIRERMAPGSLDLARSFDALAFLARNNASERELFERALAIRLRLAPGSMELATSYKNLGNSAWWQGEPAEAFDYHQRALEIQERLAPGSLPVAITLINLGNAVWLRGDMYAARDYYERALQVYSTRAPVSPGTAMISNNLGDVARALGDLDAARAYDKQAIALQEQLTPTSMDLAMFLNNLGEVERSSGNLDSAFACQARALAMQEQLHPGSTDVASSLEYLGLIASDRGDLAGAWNYQNRAMVIREQLAPASLDYALSLTRLGDVASLGGDLKGALAFHQRAIELLHRIGPNSLDLAYGLHQVGMLFERQGNRARAEESLDQAWAIVCAHRQAVTGDEASRAYESSHANYAADLMAVRLELGRTFEAFKALEESRAQGLLRLMSERGLTRTAVDSVIWSRLELAELALQKAGKGLASSGEELAKLELQTRKNAGRGANKPGSKSMFEDLTGARDRRDRAQASYTTARLEQERILGQVRQSVTGWEPSAWSLGVARGALPARSVFVAWQVGEHQSFIFVVPADSSRAILSEMIGLGERDLSRRVESFRQQIASRTNEVALAAVSRELCHLVLPASARREIERSDRVVLCPDGPLWDLPFAALATNTNGDARWLGLEKPLSYSQSLAVLLADRNRASTAAGIRQRALVVGDPVYTRDPSPSQLTKMAAMATPPSGAPAWEGERSALFPGRTPPPRIPASADEARTIAALYGTRPLVGEAATEAAVRQRISDASVVHLATHGYFNPSLPMSSGVLLTPPAGGAEGAPTSNDGALQAWEFGRSLPLTADLVVLSACETGRGAKVKGEGLVGLTRALQGAGARSVAATLWKVPDNSTAWMMLAFHRELTRGVAKDEALRRSMAITANRPATSQPYFWAGCILTGDPDRPLGLAR